MVDTVLVAVSDIHLGAFNSVWSFIVDADDALVRQVFPLGAAPEYAAIEATTAWQVGQAFATSVKENLERLDPQGGCRRKILVLNGDILDLSLAPTALAFLNARCFFHFVQKLIGFDEIVYVPGNHDHHIWRMVVESDLLGAALAQGQAHYPRTTAAKLPAPSIAGLLGSAAPVFVAYPHYVHTLAAAVTGLPRDWHVVFHHGHLLERWWTAVSTLLPAEHAKGHSLEALEALNEPLTELLWFSIGDAGRLSDVASGLYAAVSDRAKLRRLVARLAEDAGTEIERRWLVKPSWRTRLAIGALTRVLPSVVTGSSSAASRDRPTRITLTAAGLRGATLDAGLLDAATVYRSRHVRNSPSCFVLGHTHQTQASAEATNTSPAEGPKTTRAVIDLRAQENVDDRSNGGFETRILNTGGWVVEPHHRSVDASYVLVVGDQLELVHVDVPPEAVQTALGCSGLLGPEQREQRERS